MMVSYSHWSHMSDEEKEKHMDKVEEFWLDDPDTTYVDCKNRYLFPSAHTIGKLLRARNSKAKKGRRISTEEMRSKLGGGTKISHYDHKRFAMSMSHEQSGAKKKAHKEEGNYYIPRNEIESYDD